MEAIILWKNRSRKVNVSMHELYYSQIDDTNMKR